jgi:hypothetical protein
MYEARPLEAEGKRKRVVNEVSTVDLCGRRNL